MKRLNLCKIKLTSALQVRWASANYKLTDDIENAIQTEEYKPKKHPGIISYKNCDLPNWLNKALKKNLKNSDKDYLIDESKKLVNYLHARCIPLEDNEIKQIYTNLEKDVIQNEFHGLSEENIIGKKKLIEYKTLKTFKSLVYNWKAIEYNKIKSLMYMIGRAAPEYSALISIFNEIQSRDVSFNPKTLLDFGSGIGSVLWAATNMWKNIDEYMGIDISNDMNELAKNILQGSPIKIKNISHRQYIPFSDIDYDIIVSAYSLMELPNAKQRLDIIRQLWEKTNKYLVIAEQGTNAGFRVTTEIREFVDYMSEHPQFKSKYYIFAPCPHKMECPRIAEDLTPCNFASNYLSPFLKLKNHKSELFSYIVIKKDNPTEKDSWSRVIRPTIVKKGHVICKLCTSHGKLENITITRKTGNLYKCARKTEWGDRLPIEMNNTEESFLKNERLYEIIE